MRGLREGGIGMYPWAAFLTYAAVTAITPGPNNIMSMANASRVGFRRAVPFNLGILAGFCIIMPACALLASLLNAALPAIKLPMLALGAAYMLYLAWETWRSGPIDETKAVRGGFWQGLLLQFINPKIYIYGLMSMQAYVLPHYAGQILPITGFALLLALMGFVSTLLWALFGSAFRTLFSQHAHVTNAVMALLLVYCAVSLFL